MKKISVLGSTGSIGKTTLEVVRRFPERFKVVGLAARKNTRLLESQIDACNPEVVAVFDELAGRELKKSKLSVEILTGEKGVVEVATLDHVDMVVSAIVGSAALVPTYAAIKAGKDVALASKESLVMGGSIIMTEVLKKKAMIIPIDSEHSAIFQCINSRKKEEIKKIILTASGGPFLRKPLSELDDVTPEAALRHPNWFMGKKITIDSATLMNKGLEVIEAHWLFGLPAESIKVLLHPQSIIHSMVEFIDGSVISQMSVPDMKGPISYALSYPERFEDVLPSLDFSKVKELSFEEPDWNKYRCLSLAYDALNAGGTMPSVLNAANEVAVDAFLNKKILFTQIPDIVFDTMSEHRVLESRTIEDVISASDLARKRSEQIVESLKN